MNGKIQGIIICTVIAASLAGVMVFLNSTGEGKDKEDPSSKVSASSEDESVVILEKSSDDIKEISVENSYCSFKLYSPASGKSVWEIAELSGINQNSTMKNSMISNCGGLEAKKLVEKNAGDMAKYGLDKPTATFKIAYKDGTETAVDVGTEAPNERYSYVRIQGSSDVYMVLGSKLSYFTGPFTDFAALTLIDKPSESDWPEYGVETVTRKDWDYEVMFENDPKNIEGMLSSQVISSPIFSYLNITGSSAVTHGMWGLTASGCTVLHPEGEDLAEYGISDPFATVSLKGEGYDYLLKIGNEVYEKDENGEDTGSPTGYYCYLEGAKGVDAIYTVSLDNLPWATFRIEDVISSVMTSNYIVDLSEISIDHNGEKTVYEIESNGSSSNTNEDGSAAEVTKVTCGGKDIDVENFKSLYQYILTCPTGEICFEEPEGSCELTIVQQRSDGGSDILEFYKDTSRRYIVKLNGKPSFRIQSTWIDTLMKNAENVQKGIAVDENF